VAKSAQRIAKAQKTVLDPAGINLLQANGAGAGQSVPHLHIHCLPRRAGDDLKFNWDYKAGDMADVKAIFERLKAAL
jgi:histidine triad (HIT) family protein